MTEEKTNHSKPVLLSALMVLLIAVAGFQTWYMMDMKHKLDTITSKNDISIDNTNVAQADSSKDDQTASLIAGQDPITQIPDPQQPATKPDHPALTLNDNFFNQPFGSSNWDPYQEIQRMQQEMDRVFSSAFNDFGTVPSLHSPFADKTAIAAMDLKEDQSRYIVTMDIPGTNDSNISVNLDGQQLTVSGEQDFNQQKQGDQGNVILQEHRSGKFQRSITLPQPVKQSSLTTQVDHGVLTITVSKLS